MICTPNGFIVVFTGKEQACSMVRIVRSHVAIGLSTVVTVNTFSIQIYN